MSGSTPYDVSSRSDTGLFAQYTGTTGAWRLEASARGDDNQQFGQHFTGSIAAGYQVSPSWGLVAQYGTAFRAPTFNELYYPFFGNPALDPETSRSAELAAKGQTGTLHWRVSLFDTQIRRPDRLRFELRARQHRQGPHRGRRDRRHPGDE